MKTLKEAFDGPFMLRYNIGNDPIPYIYTYSNLHSLFREVKHHFPFPFGSTTDGRNRHTYILEFLTDDWNGDTSLEH